MRKYTMHGEIAKAVAAYTLTPVYRTQTRSEVGVGGVFSKLCDGHGGESVRHSGFPLVFVPVMIWMLVHVALGVTQMPLAFTNPTHTVGGSAQMLSDVTVASINGLPLQVVSSTHSKVLFTPSRAYSVVLHA